MSEKRFKYYMPSQMMEDKETGRRYFSNKQITDLLNELHEENLRLSAINKEMAKILDEECPDVIVKWM